MQLTPRIDMAGGESRFWLPNAEDPDRPWMDATHVALRFQEAGARRIQVIDVDRATEHGDNDDVLSKMLGTIGLPVEVGGGVRSMKRIQELLDTGAAKVILSTMGVMHLDWLREVGILFGQRVVQSMDLRGGSVLVKGRTQASRVQLADFLRQADGLGVGAFIVNGCDESFGQDQHQLVADLIPTLKTPVWIAGAKLDVDVMDSWSRAGAAGVVLGPELYDGSLDFRSAAERFEAPPAV